MLYQDYKFTRQYLEAQYATAVQQTGEATTNYNVVVNERDTASKADQPSYDDKVASASQQLDYAKDTERAAANDLTQLKIDPALRDNAQKYEAEKAGQDPSKEWYTKHDNEPKEDKPSALQNFAMQAGVAGVIATQALTSTPSAHAIQSELRQDQLLAAKTEAQFQSGSQNQGSQQQQQQQQQPWADQKVPETSGPGKEGASNPAEQRAPEQHPPEQHAQASQQQQPHSGDQKGPETPATGKEGAEKQAEHRPPEQQMPQPTEQVTAGPSEKELKQEEKQQQKDDRSEQAAQNTEQLHHGLEEIEKSSGGGKTDIHPGGADFGAPGYPDPERSAAMQASLQSPQGAAHQTEPAQGDAKFPPTERPVEIQAKGEAQFGAQAHPDPERSAGSGIQSGEPKGEVHETAAVQGNAEFKGQGPSNPSQGQSPQDQQAHQTEARGEASFGSHNYPNPEREQQMAAALQSPAGGAGAAEHSSATYSASNGAQPREMPPTEQSASQIAQTQPPPQQPNDPDHGH